MPNQAAQHPIPDRLARSPHVIGQDTSVFWRVPQRQAIQRVVVTLALLGATSAAATSEAG